MFIRSGRNKSHDNLDLLSDNDLVKKYRNSADTGVITVLFNRYTHLVYGVSLKYLDDKDDAKDAVMEIFEKLMDDLLIHEIYNFKSWLHSVTRNHCLMKLRKMKPVRMEMERMEEETGDGIMENWDLLHQEGEISDYSNEDLDKALNSLKGPQKLCIELVYLKGKSYLEVSGLTGFNLKQVKSHIQNGKRNLKIKLESQNAGKE